jgi:hypothetical protein
MRDSVNNYEVDLTGNSFNYYKIENISSVNIWMAQNVFCHSPEMMS